MPPRKGGLWLPLDVNFFDDPKVVRAGEDAAVLYLAMALACKRLSTDGTLDTLQIDRLHVKSWKRRLQTLIDVDLVIQWDDTRYALVAWLKHNASAAEIDAARNKDAAHKKATREARQRVYTRDSFACVYCGATADLTIDHVQPVVSGGSHDDDNMQTLCKSCNSKKGRRDGTGLTPAEARVAFGIRPRFTGHSPDTTPDKGSMSNGRPAVREEGEGREEKEEGSSAPDGRCGHGFASQRLCPDCRRGFTVVSA